ncbi:N-acetyltransferase [Sphaerisporangium siamense]|uniref:GNAT superfamily N-acetyltransferase n=1 Tax=Sphaerisporangium siamense TaxID=795645 RepID=A0A7W7D947_9ACTN|nr:GNAT family N-acetyltransferase [Sphaerisporangium siamense]MBB4701690.1 GNAT superfamily N-acetyltransferase [Sphaerisporangium siamense]GII84406.1 N-acetyltransferase [Sphaerisporangium siamense]
MTSLDDLRPSPPVAGLRLERVAADSPLIPDVQARIGAPHGWRSASRTPQEWSDWLSHPLRQYWLIMDGPRVAGIADIEPHPGGDVEITTFGLLPEFVGKGLGGYALTLAIAQAWRVEPLEADAVRRVWLHTSTNDHPNALPNYTRRGLRPFRTETVSPDGPA